MNAINFFSKEDKELVKSAVKEAELNTSGEIRVHIDNHCKKDVMDRAAEVFAILKMHKTKLRNGVLFYMALKDHKFAILGDAGINQTVAENFWDDIKEKMLEYFKDDKITEGLSMGIEMAGEALQKHFPIQDEDVNELSDEISFGNN